MRLIIVSNRLPFTVSFKNGAPEFKPSAGGLTTGLWSYLERKPAGESVRLDFLWMGWPGATVPPEHEEPVRAYAAATPYRSNRIKVNPTKKDSRTRTRMRRIPLSPSNQT
jgi:trehalose-6-phosphate synthase